VYIFSSNFLRGRFSAVKLLHLGLPTNCKILLFSNFSRWQMIYANLSILAHLQFNGATRSTPSQGPLPTPHFRPEAIRQQYARAWAFGARRGPATKCCRGLLRAHDCRLSSAQPPTAFLTSPGPRNIWSIGRGTLNPNCWAKGRSGRSLSDLIVFLDLTFCLKRRLVSFATL
jgi:hypothetical protein